MKLSELLKEETVTLTAGDYLVANTSAWGYVPTHKDTQAVQSGRHLFQIVKPTDGAETDLNIVPVETSDDAKTQEANEDTPIVKIEANKVTYVTGRNDPTAKDGYHGVTHHEKDEIEAGEEHREAILAFIDFANSQFSLGVNDFQIASQEQLEG